MLDTSKAEKYLGRKVCLSTYHETELANRTPSAWAAFGKYKAIFSSQSYSFRLKAKLFKSVVTPALLYGAASWTLTQSLEKELTSTWRKMLRTMLPARRCPDEEWVDVVRRTTHIAEHLMCDLDCESWVYSHRRRKWHFARNRSESHTSKWSERILGWKPFFRCLPTRRPGHPHTRWEDGIIQLVGGDWTTVAKDIELWDSLEDGFVRL